jgi:hypothetical protein
MELLHPTKGFRYRGFIEVKVGEGEAQRTFGVHETLIINRSLFFKKAISGSWREAEDREVALPDDEPEVFALYIHYLYTGTLAAKPDPIPPQYRGGLEYLRLTKLYVLAEKLQDITQLKNSIIKNILDISKAIREDRGHHCPGQPCISVVYNGTPEGSPARRLLVDFWTYRAQGDWIAKSNSPLPEDFVHDLCANALNNRYTRGDQTLCNDAFAKYMVEEDKSTRVCST